MCDATLPALDSLEAPPVRRLVVFFVDPDGTVARTEDVGNTLDDALDLLERNWGDDQTVVIKPVAYQAK